MSNFSTVQKSGYGLMNFTWVASRKFTGDEFNERLKQVIDGSRSSPEHPLFLNGGEFYGIPDRHEGLKLLGGFFKKYPEYADRIYLSIKAGTTAEWGPDTSSSNLAKAIAAIDEYLQPLYAARRVHPAKLDMFTVARIGEEPIEDVVRDLQQYIAGNKISSLCLSEVSANTLSRAIKVGKISAVEVEFSLFHREGSQNGLFDVCVENNIPVVCYSPLGKGLLVGQKPSDLSKDDMRNHFDKFSNPEVFKNNSQLVDKVHDVAVSAKLDPAQVALSWITTLSGKTRDGIKYPKLLPIPGSVNPDRQLTNLNVVELPESVMEEIDQILRDFKTAGHRYNAQLDSFGYK